MRLPSSKIISGEAKELLTQLISSLDFMNALVEICVDCFFNSRSPFESGAGLPSFGVVSGQGPIELSRYFWNQTFWFPLINLNHLSGSIRSYWRHFGLFSPRIQAVKSSTIWIRRLKIGMQDIWLIILQLGKFRRPPLMLNHLQVFKLLNPLPLATLRIDWFIIRHAKFRHSIGKQRLWVAFRWLMLKEIHLSLALLCYTIPLNLWIRSIFWLSFRHLVFYKAFCLLNWLFLD